MPSLMGTVTRNNHDSTTGVRAESLLDCSVGERLCFNNGVIDSRALDFLRKTAKRFRLAGFFGHVFMSGANSRSIQNQADCKCGSCWRCARGPPSQYPS
jgi:hypothetical protein